MASSRTTSVVVLLTLVLVGTACGDDGGGGEDSASGPAIEGALATVIRIDAAVDARIDTATDFTEVGEPAAVNPGDQVRTDPTGFAEITYFDGSLTRLDTDTDFTVTDLTNEPEASTIRTEMGTGRTWHRVEELTGDDTYQVTTNVATATVRGTAFVITCPDDNTCTFDLLDGTLDIEPAGTEPVALEAGESLTITADQPTGEPAPIDPSLFSDAWVVRNADLDAEAGHGPLDDTSGGGASGADENAASPEFCAAWNNIELEGIFIGDNSVEDLIAHFREQWAEALVLAPDELKPSVQQLLDIEIDPNDAQASSAAAAPIVADIDSFVRDNCAPIPDPTFTFERSEQAGDDWILFIGGVCPDGSFPTDVTGPSDRLFEPPFTATDLGNGSYSLGTYDLPGYTEAQLLGELAIPEGVDGTCG